MARKIVLTSGKGGVGKTTVCANLGANLAKLGFRVVLLDVDDQLARFDVGQALGDSRLLVGGVVLVNDALGNGFIYNGHDGGEHFLRFVERQRVDGVVEFAYGVVHLRTNHSVFQILLLDDEHAFLGRLDVGHGISPSFSYNL